MGGDAQNPFQSPTQTDGPVLIEPGTARGYARSRVMGPAIALIITGALGSLTDTVVILLSLLRLVMIQLGRGEFHGHAQTPLISVVGALSA